MAAGDLAGYRIYWSDSAFSDPQSASVDSLPYVEGSQTHLLAGLSGETFISISSLDINGNESELSAQLSVSPLTGSVPGLLVTTSSSSGLINDSITVTASGAESYDYDRDGDGIFDVTADSSGSFQVDTSRTGIIRPRVRAVASGGNAVAHGSVSLFVTGNSRPAASAVASPQSGQAPLNVTFSGEAEDSEDALEDLSFAWDFDGDGIFEDSTDSLTPPAQIYNQPGTYNAKLRVTDTEGAWDVDTVAVNVTDAANLLPTITLQIDSTSGDAPLTVNFSCFGSDDPDGQIVEFAWDWDGDGLFDAFTESTNASHTYSEAGVFNTRLRVEDNDGGRVVEIREITVNAVGNSSPMADITATPDFVELGNPITLDASGSTDSDGTIVNYDWDFEGDGLYDGFSDVSSIDHIFTELGVYNARVRVTDDDGAQDTAFVQVSVGFPGNDVPIASLVILGGQDGDFKYGYQGMSAEFDASASFDPDGMIVNFEWDFNGDGYYEAYGMGGNEMTYFYNNPGVFSVNVRVTDDSGDQASDNVDIRVNELFDSNQQWPAPGFDIRNSGRSPWTGIQSATLAWSFDTGAIISSTPAIAADGTVYIGNRGNTLRAMNPDGSLKWSLTLPDTPGDSSPTIGPDGTIYIGCVNDRLYAISPQGGIKWSWQGTDDVVSAPAISPDGRILVINGQNISAIFPDGSLDWNYTNASGPIRNLAIAADGTIYSGTADNRLLAVNPDGSLKWSYVDGLDFNSSPAVGPDGTIYVGSFDDSLYAISTDGNLEWSFPTAGNIRSSPTIGADGTIYIGSWDDFLYAINPDGTEAWSFETDNDIDLSDVAIAADGSLYVGSWDHELYCFSSNVANAQPMADISSAQPWADEGGQVSFDASASSDGDGSIVLYEWDFNGDGSWDSSGSSDAASASYSVPGVYSAVVRVTDNLGATDEASLQVHINEIFELDHTWPMLGRNPRHTGRSPLSGPQTDNEDWFFATGDFIIGSSPVIAASGVIYIASWDGRLYAINSDGSQFWNFNMAAQCDNTAAIGYSNQLYIGSDSGQLHCISPSGSQQWVRALGGAIKSSAVVGSNGTVYVGCMDSKFYAYTHDGDKLWEYSCPEPIQSSPALGADGTIYFGCDDDDLYALNPDGSLKWSYTTGSDIRSSPAIGNDGSIYFGSDDGNMYAINPDGSLSWSYSTGDVIACNPAIAADGKIIFHGDDGNLTALNPDGSLAWDESTAGGDARGVTIDSVGNIYFVSSGSLYGYTSSGSQIWNSFIGGGSWSVPAIGEDGSLYVGGADTRLHAFRDD